MPADMRQVKCAMARGVVDVLRRAKVDVLYVGDVALDSWQPWGMTLSDDLQLLIRHEQLDPFMQAMDQGGYVPAMYDPQAGRCRPLDPQQAKRALLKIPVTPEPFYVERRWASESGEPDLLIRFHTTRLHGRLLLADLTQWFDDSQQCQVMGGTQQATEVRRPPLWAMMLWQAGELMNHASDCAITKDEVDKLHLIAQQPDLNWSQVRSKAEQYTAEYDNRMNSAAARELLEDYRESLGIGLDDLEKLDKAERQYGALYELGHSLRALRDYGGEYAASVDQQVWSAAEPVTAQRPRKLWGYPGGQEDVPGPCALGRLGLAEAAFGIHQQIEEHADADFDYLVYHGLATVLLQGCPPHGPWAHCTARRLREILA